MNLQTKNQGWRLNTSPVIYECRIFLFLQCAFGHLRLNLTGIVI